MFQFFKDLRQAMDDVIDIKYKLDHLDHHYHLKAKSPQEILEDNIFQETPFLSLLQKRDSLADEKVQSKSGGSGPTTGK